MASDGRTRIGFIGLGMMGAGMAHRLLLTGRPLIVVANRDREGVEALTAAGAVEADDAGALAEAADVIVTCVPDSPAVAVVAEAILPRLRPGQLWIDVTTADPGATRALATRLAPTGAAFADAPVTGGPAQAEAGALASMVGCAPDDWDRVRATVGAYSTVVRRFGDVGAGHTAKLLNNLVTQGTMVLLAEAYGMARRAGVDWQALFEVMGAGAARSGTLEKAVGPALLGDFDGSRFTIRNAAKDLAYAAALFREQGRAAPIVEAARERLAGLVEQGQGGRFVSRLLDPAITGEQDATEEIRPAGDR